VGVIACLAAGCGGGKVSTAPADFNTWKSYDQPTFSAKFPSTPKPETQHISQSNLNVDVVIYKADLGTDHYAVSTIAYPDTVDLSNPADNLNRAISGALGTGGLKNPRVVKQNSATVGGNPAMEVEAKADNAYLFLEAILKGHTLFQVLTTNDNPSPPASAQAFIDSLTIK